MDTYVILRRGGWSSVEELEETAARSKAVGEEEMPDRVRWIRTYVLEEEQGLGTACIYEARDPESLREHARRTPMPCDEIVRVADTLILRDDPEAPAPAPSASEAGT